MLSDRQMTALFTSAQVDEAPDPAFLDELFALLVEEAADVRPDLATKRANAGAWASALRWPRGWRWSLLVAAGVVVAIVGLGLVLRQPGNVGGPSPSPFGSPAPSPAPSTPPSPTPAVRVAPSATLVPFTSSLYGYSLSYPANWKTRASVGALDQATYPYDFDPAVDYFSVTAPDVGDPGLIVAGPVVTGGTTLTSWATAIQNLQANTLTCPPATSTEDVQIGGQAGRLLTWVACPTYVLWAGVVHGGRAYHIVLIDQFAVNDGTLQAADKALLLRILGSFKFTDGPSPSAT